MVLLILYQKNEGESRSRPKEVHLSSESLIDLDQSLFTFSKNRVVFLLIALDFFVKIWYSLLKFEGNLKRNLK